jgi:LDH2 family malate/lactate/ureidoglycolate dehydrogenase
VVDGQHGFGQLVGEFAADLALEAAATHGVSAVAARNAGHIGRLGVYTERIAQAGMVGILLVNFQGGDQLLAPFGALERRLGNNPVSIAVPGTAVLDIALSVASEGRVAQAQERGEMLPAGWIMDAEGAPSRDPADYLMGRIAASHGRAQGLRADRARRDGRRLAGARRHVRPRRSFLLERLRARLPGPR